MQTHIIRHNIGNYIQMHIVCDINTGLYVEPYSFFFLLRNTRFAKPRERGHFDSAQPVHCQLSLVHCQLFKDFVALSTKYTNDL